MVLVELVCVYCGSFGAVVMSEGGAVVKGRNWERGGNAGAKEEGWKNKGRVVCGIRFGLALGADD